MFDKFDIFMQNIEFTIFCKLIIYIIFKNVKKVTTT